MKKILLQGIILFASTLMFSCSSQDSGTTETTDAPESTTQPGGQANVKDDVSMKDIVKIAVGSPDHTTLVAALKQAELVDVLANPGPFTVFAPTNAAFDKLPAGTVDDLMKDANKETLQDVLQYHVTTSSLTAEMLQDGQVLGMVNGGSVTVSKKDGKIVINGNANVVATIRGSNGIVHVVDAVLSQQK